MKNVTMVVSILFLAACGMTQPPAPVIDGTKPIPTRQQRVRQHTQVCINIYNRNARIYPHISGFSIVDWCQRKALTEVL